MTESFWTFSISTWKLALCLTLILISARLAFLRLRNTDGGKSNLVLEILRGVIVLALTITLLRPELVHSTHITEKPVIAILCDKSGSMETVDLVETGQTPTSRSSWLQKQKDAKFWSRLEAQYKIFINDFSIAPKPELMSPDENPGTDINLALDNAYKKHDKLRAILLLSDGDWNMGKSPVTAAALLGTYQVPVYAVSVGSDHFLPDIDLKRVSAPVYGLMDEHISIAYTVQSHLNRDISTKIELVSSSGVASSKNIEIPAMSQFQDTIILTPKISGEHRFTLRIPVHRDEIISDNNSKDFLMTLKSENLKVLVIDTLPRWEFRYLFNALRRDPGVTVDCLLQHPDIGPAKGRNYIQTFPADRDELSKYDVVFVGDVGIGPGGITAEQATLLKGLVEKQGSGLVFLPGYQGNQIELLDSDLNDIMPVTLDTSNPKGSRSSIDTHIMLTSLGKDHLLTMLATDAARNHYVWKGLPGFYWHAPALRAKTGTSILAVHPSARSEHGRVPLLVTKTCGNGKTLFMGTDNIWRWRRGVEDKYHYRFWGQVVRWMSHQRHMSHKEGIRFFYSPESPSRGNKIFLHATVMDHSGFPVEDSDVEVSISTKEGFSQKLKLNPEDAGWGVFTGSFTPEQGGTYNIEINCKDAERVIRTQIDVTSPKRERTGRPARISIMRDIANITGGKAGTATELDQLINDISVLPEPEPIEERFRLWCHPIWAGMIILLLAIYWSGRKLIGLL